MAEADLSKLSGTRELTLWNVRFPIGFRFRELDRLEFLDIRGGSKADLSELDGCVNLQCLVVNQVRALTDITAISGLTGLRMLSLYGLAKVEELPDLSSLARLERVDIGQMRALAGWDALTTAPAIREVFFSNLLHPDLRVMEALASQPRVTSFDWIAPDVPARVQDPIRERLAGLPKTRPMRPEEWFHRARDE